MKEIQSYINNSLCKTINDYSSINEQQMMIDYGKSFDSLFYKWNTYNYKYKRINESYRQFYNENLTYDESNAAKELLISIATRYLESLENELNDEVLNEGLKDKLKEIRAKAAEKVENIKIKINEIKEFIKDVANKAINTIKDLVKRITSMMISLGCNLAELVKKLGGNDEESQKVLQERVEEALKDEKTSKENVYESFAIELQNSINEGLFNRKKKKEEESSEEGSDEYDDTIASKHSKGTTKGGGIWKTVGNIILQLFAYYGVTVVLPAIITLIAGPVAGAIAAAIAKVLWSSFSLYKQIKREIEIRKKPDGEYHHYPKWRKIIHNIFFLASVIGATVAGFKGIQDGMKIVDALKNNSEEVLKTILPPENVQKLLKFTNDHIKSLDGIKGYDELVKAQNEIAEGLKKIGESIQEIQGKVQEMDPDTVKGMQDFISKEMQGVKASEWNKVLADKFPEIKDSLPQGYDFITGNVAYKGGIKAILATEEGQQFLKEFGDVFKYTSVQSANSAGKTYSCIMQIAHGSDKTQACLDAFDKLLKGASGGNGAAQLLGSTAAEVATETVPKLAKVIGVVGSSIPFGGLFPIAMKGPDNFRIRLGSNRSGNSGIYEVTKKKEMSFADCKKSYGEKNPKVFENMEKIINKNYKELESWKSELEKDAKANKKAIKNVEKSLETMKSATSDYKLLVFLGHPVKLKKKEETTEETKNESTVKSLQNYIVEKSEESSELVPIMFINPMLMGCGDLANRSASKGPRAKLYYFKGLLSSIEILTKPGGASQKDIIDMFISMLQESIKSNLNMVPDKPCTKDGRKYVVNKDSQKQGNRDDFGDFTNEEITEIINDKNEAGKYLGGNFKSKNNTIEKKNSDKEKEHNEKVKADFKKYIKEDDKVKKFLDEHKKLKRFLIDKETGEIKEENFEKLSDIISRSEAAYLSGKKKKGFFKKLKSFFSGDEDGGDSELEKIDKDDLSELSLIIHKLRSQKRKKEEKNESLIHPLYISSDIINESIIEDTIFECNMQMMIDEFSEWLKNEDMFDEDEPLID